jgi:hypothetical protein
MRGRWWHVLRARLQKQAALYVVHKTGADANQCMTNPHAEWFETVRISDAGEHQQLRRIYRATAEDDLASGFQLLEAAIPEHLDS